MLSFALLISIFTFTYFFAALRRWPLPPFGFESSAVTLAVIFDASTLSWTAAFMRSASFRAVQIEDGRTGHQEAVEVGCSHCLDLTLAEMFVVYVQHARHLEEAMNHVRIHGQLGGNARRRRYLAYSPPSSQAGSSWSVIYQQGQRQIA